MKPTLLLLAALLLVPLAALHATETPQKPNILFIVADDMGYADCGVQGCKDVPTPHLDSLATQGIRFTDASGWGKNIQRTMRLLATSTPEHRNTVSILFYGQSISHQNEICCETWEEALG